MRDAKGVEGRDAEGVEMCGEGCPLPQRTMGAGERRNLSHAAGSGAEPWPQTIFRESQGHKTHLVA